MSSLSSHARITETKSTPDRGADPLPLRRPTNDTPTSDTEVEPPVAGNVVGRPATNGAQRGATLEAGFGAWGDDGVQLKRSIDDTTTPATQRRTSGYVSEDSPDWHESYVTERRQRGDNSELLLKSPGDFCTYVETREDSQLPTTGRDGEARSSCRRSS